MPPTTNIRVPHHLDLTSETPDSALLKTLNKLWTDKHNLVVITGAGISVSAGSR
jgi:hypothetical protein